MSQAVTSKPRGLPHTTFRYILQFKLCDRSVVKLVGGAHRPFSDARARRRINGLTSSVADGVDDEGLTVKNDGDMISSMVSCHGTGNFPVGSKVHDRIPISPLVGYVNLILPTSAQAALSTIVHRRNSLSAIKCVRHNHIVIVITMHCTLSIDILVHEPVSHGVVQLDRL
ncbi:hypothetical protein P153DRAFT_46821 [Dothidotthia symphoricarpi CBS 119687]|uniref:Uncharacterized protein n=1 Tax=Dothidotthia symphoricarpi CBS 119687 TaxID=1392245 RepID=A0A6A6AAA9_9PLEO|nr:uncharacterized protein P153DRAFT_46821 [Dothidotthia symphoricarpi CBS 119687]KAF2128024.1 hypothetical protein P153DRAFT_46821 [Dothidotthia symphoricarpi CBS 119687]